MTSLTVALCTHNRKQQLAQTLQGLNRLRPPPCPWEILIVDNASNDGTTELLSQANWRGPDVKVRVVREEKLGLSHARNCAIREAFGEYIVFIDDDETPDPGWLLAYENLISAERPDGIGGRIEVTFEGVERPPWLQNELLGFLGKLDHGRAARSLVDQTTPIFGGNFGFRKEVFARIGMFDANLGRKGTINIGGEDTEMFRRMLDAGCNIWWVPDAIMYHRVHEPKLRRRYFLELHFRQGRTEGMRKRDKASRVPPAYLFAHLLRAVWIALSQRFTAGRNASLRKEMNVTYFIGFIYGWAFGSHLGD